jgi:hypothetical protein
MQVDGLHHPPLDVKLSKTLHHGEALAQERRMVENIVVAKKQTIPSSLRPDARSFLI